ncbi:MAG: hypothetical protein M3R02_18255 [Chloroflexota bacterium]|nr:hypothetical protein [Chloroflexota bacterium]
MLAEGGRILGSGYAIVGERGPEVRWLNRGETISPITDGPGGRGPAVVIEQVVIEGTMIAERDAAYRLGDLIVERFPGLRQR